MSSCLSGCDAPRSIWIHCPGFCSAPVVQRVLSCPSTIRTGASSRNWAAYGADIDLPGGFESWRLDLLTDPQTSGGLLISVAEADASALKALARIEGFAAHEAGRVVEGPPHRAQVGHQPNSSAEVVRVAFGNDERLPPHLRAR